MIYSLHRAMTLSTSFSGSDLSADVQTIQTNRSSQVKPRALSIKKQPCKLIFLY